MKTVRNRRVHVDKMELEPELELELELEPEPEPDVADASTVFVVSYDYDPQGQEGCMSLSVGQRVVVTDWSNAEWWTGHLEHDPSVSGAFPASFVSAVAAADPPEAVPPESADPGQELTRNDSLNGFSQEALFAAAYVYDPQGQEGCLPLAVGDVVVVHDAEEGAEWWTGFLQRDPAMAGAFPASFVEPQSDWLRSGQLRMSDC